MSESQTNLDRAALLAWLRNERRLGVAHIDISAASTVAEALGLPADAAVMRPTSRAVDRPVAARSIEPARGAERATPTSPAHGIAQDLPVEALPAPVEARLPEAEVRAALQVLDEQHVRPCTKCQLHAGRKQTVFGVGCVNPEVVFVGEGPGADEDEQGQPFVGRAGQLLTRMIAAMTLTRDQVYICNVVKCRPPDNRTPTDAEMSACSPYLFRQLSLLRPRVIVALGRPASQTLLATTTPISRLRGEFHDFPPLALQRHNLPQCKLMPTFHPAYLLRSPDEKTKAWEDLKQVMRFVGIPIPSRYE